MTVRNETMTSEEHLCFAMLVGYLVMRNANLRRISVLRSKNLDKSVAHHLPGFRPSFLETMWLMSFAFLFFSRIVWRSGLRVTDDPSGTRLAFWMMRQCTEWDVFGSASYFSAPDCP